MSSPLGFVAGGIVFIGLVVDDDRVRFREVGEAGLANSSGRGKKNDNGFQRNFERRECFRTLRYMLKDLRARLA